MISKSGSNFDIILISGEFYDDHPLSPVGIIARVLDAKGYRVGIIEKPKTENDFTKLGSPKLCFCISAGSIDSMLYNYTPMKRKREFDHKESLKIPNRAIIYYCNEVKKYFKESIIVIGGIEASLRRFAHYDYWDNKIRRSILLDSRADILVYGNGEKQIMEIADRLKHNSDLCNIPGTCILEKEVDSSFMLLPSFQEISEDKEKFCIMQRQFCIDKNLAQEYTNSYILQYKYPVYTSEDLDWIYALPYSRKMHPDSLLKMAKFSVVTHRGCFGNCHFCSIALHQGSRIISRSEKSILDEIKRLTEHPDFKGYIDDLGGPSANMYGMKCNNNEDVSCNKNCMNCSFLEASHKPLIELLRKARQIKGVKKIFVRSGIRFDLALKDKEYIRELSKYHVSGCLKIAPEHFSSKVLRLMNKEGKGFDEFVSFFKSINADSAQFLRYYFMIGHPGDSIENVKYLQRMIKQKYLKNIENFQLFTPTPMSVSTCMYWTSLDPYTLNKIDVVYDYNTKKKMKRMLLSLLK